MRLAKHLQKTGRQLALPPLVGILAIFLSAGADAQNCNLQTCNADGCTESNAGCCSGLLGYAGFCVGSQCQGPGVPVCCGGAGDVVPNWYNICCAGSNGATQIPVGQPNAGDWRCGCLPNGSHWIGLAFANSACCAENTSYNSQTNTYTCAVQACGGLCESAAGCANGDCDLGVCDCNGCRGVNGICSDADDCCSGLICNLNVGECQNVPPPQCNVVLDTTACTKNTDCSCYNENHSPGVVCSQAYNPEVCANLQPTNGFCKVANDCVSQSCDTSKTNPDCNGENCCACIKNGNAPPIMFGSSNPLACCEQAVNAAGKCCIPKGIAVGNIGTDCPHCCGGTCVGNTCT